MKRYSSRQVVLIIVLGFVILYYIFSLKWIIFVVLAIGGLGAFSVSFSKKIDWLWFKFAQVIGLLFSNILLTIVYFLILYPISFISNFFNKDPLMLSKDYKSYFVTQNREIQPEDFEKTW